MTLMVASLLLAALRVAYVEDDAGFLGFGHHHEVVAR